MTAANESQQDDGQPDPEAAVQLPDADELARLARHVGLFHALQGHAKTTYTSVQTGAQPTFAAVRQRGTPQLEILLADGRKAGLVVIKKGPEVTTVDEDALTLVAALNDAVTGNASFEDYAEDRALRDPRVLAFLVEHCPDLVGRRITKAVRDLYLAEIEENRGKVRNLVTGEYDVVATIDKLRATGEYSVLWADRGKGAMLLRDEADAGVIGLDGTVVKPADQPAAAGPPAEQAPAPAASSRPDDTGERYERAMSRRRQRVPKFPPTGQQTAIVDTFAEGDSVAVIARAGTGKTSTLQLVAQRAYEQGRRGNYVSFGRDIVDDARGKFGSGIKVSTAHALAKAAVGGPYQHRLDNQKRIPAAQVAKILGIRNPLRIDADHVLSPAQQARCVQRIIKGFCGSADFELSGQHLAPLMGLDDAAMNGLRSALLPFAGTAWKDIIQTGGQLRFEHDHYLKIWQLGKPKLLTDFVLFDEAQDADPVVLDVLTRQDCPIIPVGDDAQAIYEWRGAVNALDQFNVKHRLTLSQSFRFGPAIAAEANKFLTLLEADPLVQGFDRVSSMVTKLEDSQAVLCRSNTQAIAEVIAAVESGKKVALAGDGESIRWLAEAACQLKEGKPATHPELIAFQTWGQVQEYVEHDPSGQDLKVLVRLIDDHGPAKIIGIMDSLVDESTADVVISTAHKAKGREWDTVRIADDFHPPASEDQLKPEEMRLAYVAATRARLSLDRGPLAYVDWLLGGAR